MATVATAQTPVITSFRHNGGITWSNDTLSNAIYHVEWAPALNGRWYRSWQQLQYIEAHTNTTWSSSVPMFYRITMTTNSLPQGMNLVDGGPFSMGNWYPAEGQADELPVHDVFLSGFFIDKYEVSNERMRQVLQWAYDNSVVTADVTTVTNVEGDQRELVNLDESTCELAFSSGVFTVEPGKANCPCVQVSWFGALAYCNYRSDIEGRQRCIAFTDWSCDFTKNGYRLPTEAEWEKAARGGLTGHHFPWPSFGGSYTNHMDDGKANYSSTNTPIGHYNGSQFPVGADMANGYGLYDMEGNVVEWCWDWYQEDWYAQPGATNDNTTGPTSGIDRVTRNSGGRTSNRHRRGRAVTMPGLGFRSAATAF